MLHTPKDYVRIPRDETRKKHIADILHRAIPASYIARETQADIYILCPFHSEKNASLAIGKNKGLVKCFGCGRAYELAVFLSMTSGKTRSRWEHKLYGPYDWTLRNPQQILLFTQEELAEMLVADTIPAPRQHENYSYRNRDNSPFSNEPETHNLNANLFYE